MIEKVVEILLEKFLQPRTRKQRADDQAKEKFVFLHECLIHCHGAYLQYASERTDTNLESWKKAVRELAHVLDKVSLALSSFSPEGFDRAANYLFDERLLVGMPYSKNYCGGDEELMRIVERLFLFKKVLLQHEPEGRYDEDFKKATIKLREFMKEHMTVGEIQQAQEAFRKSIS